MNSRWHSVHVFIGRRAHGDVLIREVDAFLREVSAEGVNWFFIRYGEAGAHLRVRLESKAHAFLPRVRRHLRDAAGRLTAEGSDPEWVRSSGYPDLAGNLFAPGEVIDAAYEPETQRYGGNVAILENERLFCVSSAVALRAIESTPSFAGRPQLSVDLMLAAVAGLPDGTDASSLFRRYSEGWADILGVASAAVESSPEDVSKLRHRLAAYRTAAVTGGIPLSLGQHWSFAIRSASERFSFIASEGCLTSPWSGSKAGPAEAPRATEDMVLSQIHMLNNRLGYSPFDEMRWSRQLAAGLR